MAFKRDILPIANLPKSIRVPVCETCGDGLVSPEATCSRCINLSASLDKDDKDEWHLRRIISDVKKLLNFVRQATMENTAILPTHDKAGNWNAQILTGPPGVKQQIPKVAGLASFEIKLLEKVLWSAGECAHTMITIFFLLYYLFYGNIPYRYDH